MSDQWSALELRHLDSLRAIARTGSFRAAADELDYTQSAISQHLAGLESIVGVRLVDRGRGRRRVALTEAGEILVRHADAIAARLSAARADLHAYAQGAVGTLRVGTYQSVSARILPTLIGRFVARWPGVTVELRESSSLPRLVRLVEAGDLDLAFNVVPLPDGPFAHADVLHDPWYLVVAAGSELARRVPLPTLADLAEVPLIGFGPSTIVELLEQSIRAAGVEPRIVFRSDDNATIQGLVATGFGSAIMPALAIDVTDERIVCIPVDHPPRTIAIVWHADRVRSPAAAAFVSMAAEVCAEIRLD